MKKNLLRQLVSVKLADDPQQIAADLIDIVLSDASAADKAEDLGEAIDDAIILSGPVGGILETLDSAAAEHLAAIALELVGQAKGRVLERIEDQVEELEEELRDAGVDERLIDRLRDILRLDELAA